MSYLRMHLERELHKRTEVEMLRLELETARAQLEHLVRILVGIHQMMAPPKIEHEGRVLQFQFRSDVAAQLQELSDRIRAIPDEIETALRSGR